MTSIADVNTSNVDTVALAAYKGGDRSHDTVVALAKSVGFKPMVKRDLDTRFEAIRHTLHVVWECDSREFWGKDSNAAPRNYDRNAKAVYVPELAWLGVTETESDGVDAEDTAEMAAEMATRNAYLSCITAEVAQDDDGEEVIDFLEMFMAGTYHPAMSEVATAYLRVVGIG